MSLTSTLINAVAAFPTKVAPTPATGGGTTGGAGGGVILPSPKPAAPPGTADGASTILGWLQWGGWTLAIAGLIIGFVMLGISSRRGEAGEHSKTIALACVATIGIGAATGIISALIK